MKRTIIAFILSILSSAAILAGQAWVTDSDLEALIARSDAVGYLRVDTDIESYSCTAVAISENLWLTAGHCAPESSERGTREEHDGMLVIHPVQAGIPTPADMNATPPITIDGKAATFLKGNSKIALFYREEPTLNYFPVSEAPSQAGSQLWVYTATGYKPSLFSQAEVAKLPLPSSLMYNSTFREHDIIAAGSAQPGFSGSPYIAKGTDGNYYVVGVLDAITIKLYIVYYDMLPIVGLSESPYSLGYAVTQGDILSLLGGEEQ